MKRNASKRYERHSRSQHRPTKVFEFVRINLATLKVAIKIVKIDSVPFLGSCAPEWK